MKKVKITLVITLFVSLFAVLPMNVKAKTISEFEKEVDEFTADLEYKLSRIAKNDAEVAQIKAEIAVIEQEIIDTENEIETLQIEINESNLEIERKTKESEEIVRYRQISEGTNIYMEYVFDSSSITDMVYRMSIVEQLTAYNEKIMKELRDLIESNNKKQETLAASKNELIELEENLESEKERIGEDTASLKEGIPALEQQIKSAEANVKYYKSLGCGANEDIQACQYRISQNSGSSASIPSTNGFYRPMEHGYVTQPYKGLAHMGIDLGSSDKTIALYPIANGQIFKIYYDMYGALVVKIRHNYNGRYLYSTYAHLSKFANIKEGQYVTHMTTIGDMGNTGYSFGAHLHLEITSCDWNTGGGCTWGQYQSSTFNPVNYINIPSSFNNR